MDYKQVYDVGTDKRRYEPEVGIHKHNQRIHTESSKADSSGKLPFNFSKPKKGKRFSYFSCNNCKNISRSTVNTVGIVCKNCSKYSAVTEVDFGDT